MDFLAPWSLGSYLPLGGFHPLFRSLAGLPAGAGRVVVPRVPGREEFDKLAATGLYGKTPPALAEPAWCRAADSPLLRDFVSAHGASDLWLQSNLSADVELHHTAPATLGDRPFLLHCQSFLPMFLPFFQPDAAPDPTRAAAVQDFYRALLESPNCLAILSPSPDTLGEIADFFASAAIEAKLVEVPLGLDASFVGAEVANPAGLNFVFLGEFGAGAKSFRLRGGISCLKLALHLARERPDAVFHFHASRPPDGILSAAGIDLRELAHREVDRIVWIDHALPDALLVRLVSRCHMMLLPAAETDSFAVLLAMANGAVPVVTDAAGTGALVEDGVTGAVIKADPAAPRGKKPQLRLMGENSARYLAMEKELTAALIARVTAILADPQALRAMSAAGRDTARRRFDGATFAGRLAEEAGRRLTALGADASRPRPVVQTRLHNGAIYRQGRRFAFIPRGRADAFHVDAAWSPLRLAYETYSPYLSNDQRAGYAVTLQGAVARASRPHTPRRVALRFPFAVNPGFSRRVADRLRSRPALFHLVRGAYFALRRIGLVR